MHEKELPDVNEARYRADIVRLTADQNKVTQDKVLLKSRVNHYLELLAAAKYAALTETFRSV